MTREQVYEQLQMYLYIKAEIKSIEKEVQELKQIATSLGNSIGDGMPHGSGSGEARHTMAINKLCDYQIRQMERINELDEQRERVLYYISLAPTNKGRRILELRYIYGNSVKTISKAIGKSDTSIRALQNRAIDGIVERLNY